MAIGAKDFIDRLLVEKYAQEKVDNHSDDTLVSRIDAEDIMSTMNKTAYSYRHFLHISTKLSVACYSVNAPNAKYQSIPL